MGRSAGEIIGALSASMRSSALQRDADSMEALITGVRNAVHRARETGEDQFVEGITIYGARLMVKASDVGGRYAKSETESAESPAA